MEEALCPGVSCVCNGERWKGERSRWERRAASARGVSACRWGEGRAASANRAAWDGRHARGGEGRARCGWGEREGSGREEEREGGVVRWPGRGPNLILSCAAAPKTEEEKGEKCRRACGRDDTVRIRPASAGRRSRRARARALPPVAAREGLQWGPWLSRRGGRRMRRGGAHHHGAWRAGRAACPLTLGPA